MWLRPILVPFASAAIATFYRFRRSGAEIPATGPAIVVANHPNMAADGGAVLAATRRPLRFLGKAPLFANRVTGTLLRAIGAIPVHRRSDDPGSVDRNEESFRDARAALAAGDAIAIFPEGISHSEPSLTPLRTGAARIALGAAAVIGRPFPIVPIGLMYRDKTRFRSLALAVAAEPVSWDDLAGRGEADAAAVRELTGRIERALRQVTLNLERWEDVPAVEAAEAIWAAERGLPRTAEARGQRQREIARMLARLRESGSPRLERLERAVLDYDRLLRELRLRPGTLEIATRASVALRWIAGRIVPFVMVAPLLLAGAVLFVVPYRATGILARLARGPEVEATIKILGGLAIHLLWIALLATAAGFAAGPAAGLAALVLLPPAALATLAAAQWWERTRLEARSFLLLRGRETLRQRLLARRGELARELDELRRELPHGEPAPDAGESPSMPDGQP